MERKIMLMRTAKIQTKDFEAFNIIITIEDVVDLGMICKATDILKIANNDNRLGIWLERTINKHLGLAKD
jgi:hypothetical protein